MRALGMKKTHVIFVFVSEAIILILQNIYCLIILF